MKSKLFITVLMLLAFIFTVGCGDPGKTSSTQPKEKTPSSKSLVDPSALLTKAEAEEALGEPSKEPKITDSKNPLGQKLCFYDAVSDTSVKFVQISVVQNEGMKDTLRDSGYNVKQLYNDTKKNLSDAKTVSGLGDDAFWGTNGLHILKDNVYLNISVGNSTSKENEDLAINLAKKALSRL